MLTDNFLRWYTEGNVEPEDYARVLFCHLCAYPSLLLQDGYRRLYEETLDYLTKKQLISMNKESYTPEEYEKIKELILLAYQIFLKCRRDKISKDRDKYKNLLKVREILWIIFEND